ncbi:MAG: indolepyruvate ferredoxin oxidoreductase subunit alpha [Proteobacteria bacterium]|nr:indolepyruvate ferredoxin oxidoreductase subunit alpha [Pseudomonadota bacterium]
MDDMAGDHPGAEVLLQGNEAMARGALEAGVAWASGYPGNPSSEIIETLARAASEKRLYVEWSVNEKVALEAAAAASFAGMRALATMKQNGVNVCLDALTSLALSGIKGGLVLIAADDPSSISSGNEEDSRFAAALAHLPLLEPATPQEAKDMVRFAFDLSERIGNICLVRSVSRLSHTRANVILGELPGGRGRPRFDTSRPFITLPAVPHHQVMYDKLDQAEAEFEESPFNHYEGPPKPDLMIAACGPSYLYAREAVEMLGLEDRTGILKLGTTYPLPQKFVAEHLAKAASVLVAEEIDPVLERSLKVLAAETGDRIGAKRFYGKRSGHVSPTGESGPGLVARALARIVGREFEPGDPDYRRRAAQVVDELVPPREFGFCPGCPHRASYWAIKQVLASDDRQGFVVGDVGCYTMGIWPTGFNQVKMAHAMGSGVGMSSGFGKLDAMGFAQPVISVVGDSTFFHAAIPALINATYNQAGFLLVVLDNAATAMTGFQPHPGTGVSVTGERLSRISIERICDAMGLEVTVCDPYDIESTTAVLRDRLRRLDTVRVIIMRRPCALVQGRADGFDYRMHVDENLCRGEECGCDRYCNRVFRCPGLVWDASSNRARIDEVICVGCGVCETVCPAGAIVKETI